MATRIGTQTQNGRSLPDPKNGKGEEASPTGRTPLELDRNWNAFGDWLLRVSAAAANFQEQREGEVRADPMVTFSNLLQLTDLYNTATIRTLRGLAEAVEAGIKTSSRDMRVRQSYRDWVAEIVTLRSFLANLGSSPETEVREELERFFETPATLYSKKARERAEVPLIKNGELASFAEVFVTKVWETRRAQWIRDEDKTKELRARCSQLGWSPRGLMARWRLIAEVKQHRANLQRTQHTDEMKRLCARADVELQKLKTLLKSRIRKVEEARDKCLAHNDNSGAERR